MGLEEQKVPVDTHTQNLLKKVAQASAEAIYRSTRGLDPITMASVLTESIPSGLTKDRIDYAQKDASGEYTIWKQAASLPQDSIFVAPKEAGYLGLAARDRIGFNETLLTHYNPSRLAGVSRHELIHKIFNLSDYTPEFITMLLIQAQHNVAVRNAVQI